MTRICWLLIGVVGGMLEPGERDAVRGDIAESGETGGQALVSVLGLVLRRQAALWRDWRPWLALLGLVVPIGLLLGLASTQTAGGSAIYIWLYANNWDSALLGIGAFRHDLAHFGAQVVLSWFKLTCWSWIGGFVLGSVSRGSMQVNGAVFCLVLLSAQHVLGPYGARHFDNNAAVFSLTFYRVIFPVIVKAVLVILPSLWGMRQGLRLAGLRTGGPLRQEKNI